MTLCSVEVIPREYDPLADERISEWRVCLQLAKTLADQGTDPAARLMAAARKRVELDSVRELAYLIYTTAEHKNWLQTASLFNNLGKSWVDLESDSRKPAYNTSQGQL